MTLETKYDIGQRLYGLTMEFGKEMGKCECCGGPRWERRKWVVDDRDYVIIGVYVDNHTVAYKVWTPAVVVREKLPERGIGVEFFTSHEEAQAECDRRNGGAVGG